MSVSSRISWAIINIEAFQTEILWSSSGLFFFVFNVSYVSTQENSIYLSVGLKFWEHTFFAVFSSRKRKYALKIEMYVEEKLNFVGSIEKKDKLKVFAENIEFLMNINI